MDVVDERTQGRNAQPSGHQQDVMAFHVLIGKGAPVGPADAHHISALHLMETLGEFTRPAHAELNEAAFGGRAGDGDRSLPHPEDGYLYELTGFMMEGIADALIYEAEFEELLGFREGCDGGDPCRPWPVGVRHHELIARGHHRIISQGCHMD